MLKYAMIQEVFFFNFDNDTVMESFLIVSFSVTYLDVFLFIW